MIRLFTVTGARPQIIKAAAISRAIRSRFSDVMTETIIHTGQHYDEEMSGIFFSELGIPEPVHNLRISEENDPVRTMIRRLSELFRQEKPDVALVYGDTNSTLAGAFAANNCGIPLVHVEAGLRSFNTDMPEEFNRIATDHSSSLLFAPTDTAVANLEKEGIAGAREGERAGVNNPVVCRCGDIMYDNSLHFASLARPLSQLPGMSDLAGKPFFLATVHRNFNADDETRLSSVFRAFARLGEEQHAPVVVPLHPRTRKNISAPLRDEIEQARRKDFVRILPPVGFLDMITLEKNARLVLTDSGGVQKEAYFFRKPCVVLREETEWVEIVRQGCALLSGTGTENILRAARELLERDEFRFAGLFGDGRAAEFICEKMIFHFSPQ